MDKPLTPEEIHKLATAPLPTIKVELPQKSHASYGPFRSFDKPRLSE